MEGKKNIVFGFLFLVVTASLGPYMVVTLLPGVADAAAAKQTQLSTLQLAVSAEFENQETLETMTAEEIAKTNSMAILAINTGLNSRMEVDTIKGGPHAHGNLEAVLNILVGLVLGLLTIPALFKQIISWTFIFGTIAHAGMAMLGVFGFAWAGTVLGTGAGAILILLGLGFMGIATFVGYKKAEI